MSKNLQDGLKIHTVYRFHPFLSKIGRRAQILGMYGYKNWSIYSFYLQVLQLGQ